MRAYFFSFLFPLSSPCRRSPSQVCVCLVPYACSCLLKVSPAIGIMPFVSTHSSACTLSLVTVVRSIISRPRTCGGLCNCTISFCPNLGDFSLACLSVLSLSCSRCSVSNIDAVHAYAEKTRMPRSVPRCCCWAESVPDGMLTSPSSTSSSEVV